MALRVAIDATPLLGRPTGVGGFVGGLLPALLADTDCEMRAYALTLRGFGELSSRLPAGVPHNRLPMPAGILSKLWRRSRHPGAEWWTGPVDVVHGTNFVVPPARRAATLVTVHDLTALRFPHLTAPGSLAYPDLVRVAVGRGAHVHTPTSAVADEVVAELGVRPESVHAIHHGVTALATGVGTDAAAGRLLAGSDRYVLAVGTVEPRKDFPALVRAFDSIAGDHPGVHLVVAGGAGWGIEEFATAVAGARHGNRVRHLGWVDVKAHAALVRGATALAFPSVYEGFGLPPLEAMGAGVPVVATRTAAGQEVAGDAALMVENGDDLALAGALATVLDDEGERSRLIAAGRDRVVMFSWERTAKAMAALYQELATERPS